VWWRRGEKASRRKGDRRRFAVGRGGTAAAPPGSSASLAALPVESGGPRVVFQLFEGLNKKCHDGRTYLPSHCNFIGRDFVWLRFKSATVIMDQREYFACI
jgi:hypothetical protein